MSERFFQIALLRLAQYVWRSLAFSRVLVGLNSTETSLSTSATIEANFTSNPEHWIQSLIDVIQSETAEKSELCEDYLENK